jgi:anion-transporting  ArsA/GET3 family ATPase
VSRLVEILDARRLVVCVGPGGVGKTTVAASLALQAARRGRRSLVLTIDPAKRLADALGLDGLSDGVKRVPRERLTAALPGETPAELHAAMLDTKTSFDALISRIAPDEAAARRILENPVYRAFSRTLARSHAHVAMERLYDVTESGAFDLVVLDTPPLRSALEILDAPGRIVRFLDEGVVRWFVRPERGRLSRLLPRGGAAASRLLALLASKKLVEQASDFFGALLNLQQGFRDRANRMQDILREPSTAFFLVCAPAQSSLEDAAFLRDGLLERRMGIDAAIFNRAFVAEARAPGPDSTPEQGRQQAALSALSAAAEAEGRAQAARTLLSAIERLRAETVDQNRTNQHAIDGFFAHLPRGCARIELPELERDVRDIEGLARLARLLSREIRG